VALDGVPDSALIAAFQSLGLLPDSTELAVQLGRFIVLRPRSMPRPFSDPRFMRGQVARLLLARGHLRGSREYLAGHEQSLFYGEAALLGAVPAESAAAAFRTALSGPASHRLVAAFPWWSSHGDSVSLRRAEHRADSLAQSEAEPTARARARYAAAAAAAYLSLTRGDTATALKRLTALREGDCPPCYLDRFTLVQLLAERRHDREAWQILQGEHPFSTLDVTATEVLWALLRGRVGERLGHRERAVESYTWVVGMWRNADPELQPYRREAQEGLARLTGEAREPSSGSEAR
jgi:hypothetical protein